MNHKCVRFVELLFEMMIKAKKEVITTLISYVIHVPLLANSKIKVQRRSYVYIKMFLVVLLYLFPLIILINMSNHMFKVKSHCNHMCIDNVVRKWKMQALRRLFSTTKMRFLKNINP